MCDAAFHELTLRLGQPLASKDARLRSLAAGHGRGLLGR